MEADDELLWMATNHRPLVLLVDTDETARDLYGHWFIAMGCEVMSAAGILGLSLVLRRAPGL